MESSLQKRAVRNSSIELLKIIAMMFIVLSHLVQSLTSANYDSAMCMPTNDFIFKVGMATPSIRKLLITLISYSGHFGNSIFFVCSAWFLVDSKRFNKKKWLTLLINVWLVSMLFLAVTIVFYDGEIPKKLFVHSFFPTFFANNWYLTCYLIFYPVHHLINRCIDSLNQRQHLFFALAMFVMYSVLGMIEKQFFWAYPIIWLMYYVIVAYVKKYLPDISNNVKYNFLLFVFAALGNIALILAADYIGLKTDFGNTNLLKWHMMSNPFFILSSISLLNIFRNFSFKSKPINYVSSLLMFVYLVHENSLVVKLYRPYMWIYVHDNFGYRHIVFWAFALGLILYAISLIIAAFYKQTFAKLVDYGVGKSYPVIAKLYHKFETLLLRIH